MKIMIAGSRDITITPPELRVLLSACCGFEFIVGDCYGIDRLAQEELFCRSLPFTVYHIGEKPWNCVGKDTTAIKIAGSKYTDKDDAMIAECDEAWIFHNNSPGSLRVIQELKALGKPFLEYKFSNSWKCHP